MNHMVLELKLSRGERKPAWRKKILPTTWRSTLTEPIDKMIYKKVPYEEMIRLNKK